MEGLDFNPNTTSSPAVLSGQAPGSRATLLPQILDFTQAIPLWKALLGQRTIVLDAGLVERISTPCAQVLLAAGRLDDTSFRIINASAVFRAAIIDLGLQPEFCKWME